MSTAVFGTDQPHLRARLAEFEQALAEANEQFARLLDPATAQQFCAAVAKLEADGRAACEGDQAMAWAHVNDVLIQRTAALYRRPHIRR